MSSKPSAVPLHFPDVCRLVFDGALTVEPSSADVSASALSRIKRDSIAVLMHHDAPGAIVLIGYFRKRLILTAAYSGQLRFAACSDFSEFFDIHSALSPADSIHFLVGSAVDAMHDHKSDLDGFRYICGLDAVPLLRSLVRLSQSADVLH